MDITVLKRNILYLLSFIPAPHAFSFYRVISRPSFRSAKFFWINLFFILFCILGYALSIVRPVSSPGSWRSVLSSLLSAQEVM